MDEFTGYAVITGKGVTLYKNLSDIPAPLPYGPPLPIHAEYTCEEDLKDLTKMAKVLLKIRVDGTTTREHETFVKEAVRLLGPLKHELWSHHDRCYGVLFTPSIPKYLTPNWPRLSDLLTSQPNRVLYRFSTLVEATIYILANGNRNLDAWGLSKWKGMSKSDREATEREASQSRAIDFSDSEDSDPSHDSVIATPLSSSSGPLKTVNSVTHLQPFVANCPSPSASRTPAVSTTHQQPGPPMSSVPIPPGLLVSPAIWRALWEDEEAFLYSKKRQFKQLEKPISSWDYTAMERVSIHTAGALSSRLSAPVLAYLRAHGWGRETVEKIEDKMVSEPDRTGLVLWLASEGMAVTEADYLASIILS